jgi:glucose-6-phosphate dehydrogenase-like protein
VSWQRNWQMPRSQPPQATPSPARPDFRPANRVFEPIWNADHADHADISGPERLTLQRPGPSYHDRAGALKDMGTTIPWKPWPWS